MYKPLPPHCTVRTVQVYDAMTIYMKGGFLPVAALIVSVVFVQENRQRLFSRLVLRWNIPPSVVVINNLAIDFQRCLAYLTAFDSVFTFLFVDLSPVVNYYVAALLWYSDGSFFPHNTAPDSLVAYDNLYHTFRCRNQHLWVPEALFIPLYLFVSKVTEVIEIKSAYKEGSFDWSVFFNYSVPFKVEK